MPPAVMTSSPTLSDEISWAWRFCCCRCGRMSRKYMIANIAMRMRKKPLPTDNLLAGHDGRGPEAVERGRLVRGELAPLDRCARPGGQIEQKPNVVLGQKYQAEELLLVDEVAQVGAAEARARRARALLRERPFVAREAGVLEVETALPRERGARASESRREDAVEHVDASLDDLEDAGGGAHAP